MKRFFFAALALLAGVAATAQPLDPEARLPRDPDVRIGQLSNGMTYYIRHNDKPTGHAEFRIVHNVGAIQEDDSQQGLAHFLEHMAFNGTKNLPDKMIIEWLESVGVKFGANLNAFTGVELTAYEIKDVPLRREAIVDSALLILHDWSQFITLADGEIDDERGVIVEEMRQRNSPDWRLGDKTRPTIYGGTRYSYRNIIGSEQQLRSFPYQAIKDFYHKWYRPDLQAVIIIGDFDVDDMLARLTRTMADIPAPTSRTPKETILIPDNEQPLAQVVTDPELTGSEVALYIKRRAPRIEDRDKVGVVLENMLIGVGSSMANERLSNIATQPNAPFKGAGVGMGNLTAADQTFMLSVDARENEMPGAFEAAYTELERIRRYGFTQAELDIEKANIAKGNENSFAARADRRSSAFVNAYMSNFTSGRPILSAEQDYEMTKQMLDAITVESVNGAFQKQLTERNNVVIASTPEKEGVSVPAPQEFIDAMARVRGMELQPYTQESISEPLISENIKSGKVRKTEAGVFESTVWTLKNGVRVVVKPTKLATNSVSMAAYAAGGTSTLSVEDNRAAGFINGVMAASGIGKFNRIELGRVLAGTSGSAGPAIARFSTGMAGSSTTAEIEQMLQLAWLSFNEPRFEREQFDRIVQQTKIGIANAEGKPDTRFSEEVNKALYGDDPRAKMLTVADVEAIDFDRLPIIYDKFFARTARDYTFFFIGDFDPAVLRPLVEKYIGGLPTGGTRLATGNDGLERKMGRIDNRFEVAMEMPKTRIYYDYTGDIDYTLENRLAIILLSERLNTGYDKVIREKMGATYGASVRGDLMRQPSERYGLQIMLETDPALVDQVTAAIEAELQKAADGDVTADDVAKTVEFWIKSRPEQLKSNGTWLGYLQQHFIWSEDWNTNWEATVAGMTPEKVQAMARRVLADGNLVRVIMDPAK